MQAYHGDVSIKNRYIDRVKAHAVADEIVKGQYWQDGRGCAVGCTIHSSAHNRYQVELGIPTELAFLQDAIFEGLPLAAAKRFPREFLETIEVGADLSSVKDAFIVWLLLDQHHGVIRFAEPAGKIVIDRVAGLYTRRLKGDEPRCEEWNAAWTAVGDAAGAAAWDVARYATRDVAWDKQRDKLLELLSKAPIVSIPTDEFGGFELGAMRQR